MLIFFVVCKGENEFHCHGCFSLHLQAETQAGGNQKRILKANQLYPGNYYNFSVIYAPVVAVLF